MKINKSTLFALGLVIAGIAASAFPTGSQAVSRIDEKELLMGQTATITIEVPVPSDSASVEFPLMREARLQKKKYVALLNDTIEVLTDYKQSLTNRGERNYVNYSLTVQAFDSGTYKIPPFEFLVNGQPVKSDTLSLTVLPVKVTKDDPIDDFSELAQPFEDIPNPKELEEEAASTIIWWLIAAAALFLVIIAVIIIRWRKTGALFSIVKPQPPYAVALRKLRKLQEQNLPQKGKTKEYYTRLTDILRTYLRRQFGIKTLEKSTSEILRAVEENEKVSAYSGALKSIFETADFVKFAKVNPSVVENGRCLTEAERFVEASRPQETAENQKGEKR